MSALPVTEYRDRLARAQAALDRADLAGLVLTTDADIRWITGFLTRFWESPTRPWFVVVPTHGLPIAVIPAIGAAPMGRTWITDIRTWDAPNPDDDGIGLLIEAVAGCGGPVGLPAGLESHVRMPLNDLDRLRAAVSLVPDGGVMAGLRAVKSEAEIDLIAAAAGVAGSAFARVPEIAAEGRPLAAVFREFQRLCLEEGADWVPYLAGGAGQGGYSDVISPATEVPLVAGDVLMLDTGVIRDGYFCDYERNYSVGPPSPEVAEAHERLIEATAAGLEAVRPGALACDVAAEMARVLGDRAAGGRMGHGLGLQLTEGCSLLDWDRTPLVPGMVLTLEPGIMTGPDRLMVHEENIAVTEDGARRLSPFAGPEIARI